MKIAVSSAVIVGMQRSTFGALQAVQFASVVLAALALIPAGAHLFELPNKIALKPEDYMVVQSIYRGWAFFGIVIYAALAATLVQTLMLRAQGAAFWFSLLSFLCLTATQVVFWAWTFPANTATGQWTTMPPDLETIRPQWEYSHAASAVLTFAALVLTALAGIITPSSPHPEPLAKRPSRDPSG